jgi:hypothetical protein
MSGISLRNTYPAKSSCYADTTGDPCKCLHDGLLGTDLAAAVEFSWQTAYNNIQSVRPGMPVFKVSAKTGEGMEEHLKFLGASLTELRQTAAVCQISASR